MKAIAKTIVHLSEAGLRSFIQKKNFDQIKINGFVIFRNQEGRYVVYRDGSDLAEVFYDTANADIAARIAFTGECPEDGSPDVVFIGPADVTQPAGAGAIAPARPTE